MDLHAWITQQVDKIEGIARAADETLGQVLSQVEYVDKHTVADERHINLHAPIAVLRRCEADRRILARHRLDPSRTTDSTFAAACEGCDEDTTWGLPWVDNLNDCPELLDLAHAHGLTDEILAGLDRPQAPMREAREPHPEGFAGMLRDAFDRALTPPITTSDVPEALRGPHWKP
ncbi:DUF6221 family protein [Streptomyces sp. BA2]|uniref:DUF6221 family protein n=1 Tax=Streptomyces sp. BA2 TaxID=436595 RepID=UPI00132266D4|nr:DUF6221 family protein [Streptomyces sp. BA2]MWA08750.1 hypothetical protein [Streptomyces sp. BA2]